MTAIQYGQKEESTHIMLLMRSSSIDAHLDHHLLSNITINKLTSTENMFFKATPNIMYQQDEVSSLGCCFPRQDSAQQYFFIKIPAKGRIYSQPRQSKSKKLDLTIARKSGSHTKETHNSGSSSLQRRKNIVTQRSRSRESSSNEKQSTNREIKTIQEVNNSKPSRPHINNVLKHQPTRNNTQQHHYQVKSERQLFNMPDISSIAKVEEELVSQSSATFTILNTINNTERHANTINSAQMRGRPLKNEYFFHTVRQSTLISGAHQLPSEQVVSPFERMDRKRYEQKIEKTKKKFVI